MRRLQGATRSASASLWLGVLVAAALAAPRPAGGQVEALLTQRELEYRAASSAYEAAVAARQAAQARAERATVEIDEARASGDANRLERLYAVATARWTEVTNEDRRVAETRERLRRARRALRDALEASLDLLAGQARSTTSARERDELLALIRDRNNRLREIEAELAQGEDDVTRFIAMPEITFDPRDGPAELRIKADLLARRAAQADSVIAVIDREIADLQKRQRRERALRDFMSGIERFDESAVPVGRAGRDAADRAGRDAADHGRGDAAADSLGKPAPLSVDEQITQLRTLRRKVEEYGAAARTKAEIFRQRAAGVRGEE